MSSPSDVADSYNALARAQGWRSTCSATLEFESRALRDLLTIWRRLAAPIPRRRDLTPRMLRAHLADIAIYERSRGEDGRERYRVRVMGARFGSVMGDFGGKFFDEAIPPQFLARWNAAPDAVLEAGAPLRFVSRSETAGKAFITGEYLLAPLTSDGGAADTVISGVVFGPTIRTQRR